MWCQQYPQLGHSVPFVQGTSNFMLCSLKYHQRSGTRCVSFALWQSVGRLTSGEFGGIILYYKINSDWHHPRINSMGFDLYQN